jgi:hypothetical protein
VRVEYTLAFAALLMTSIAIAMGLAPHFHRSAANAQEALRGRTAAERGRCARSILVVAEGSLTVLLLAGAGLMLRSLLELRKVDPGFSADRLLAMKVTLPDTRYASRALRAAIPDRALESIRSLPGVESVAAVNHLPMSGDHDWGSFNVVGRAAEDWATRQPPKAAVSAQIISEPWASLCCKAASSSPAQPILRAQ